MGEQGITNTKFYFFYFRLKLRQNWSNLILGGLFGVTPNTVQENFITAVIYINHHFHTIPRIWSAENTTQDEMGNLQLYYNLF